MPAQAQLETSGKHADIHKLACHSRRTSSLHLLLHSISVSRVTRNLQDLWTACLMVACLPSGGSAGAVLFFLLLSFSSFFVSSSFDKLFVLVRRGVDTMKVQWHGCFEVLDSRTQAQVHVSELDTSSMSKLVAMLQASNTVDKEQRSRAHLPCHHDGKRCDNALQDTSSKHKGCMQLRGAISQFEEP